MVSRQLKLTRFADVSLADPFFDSLKAGYRGFPRWFADKGNAPLYVVADGKKISGMIYVKREDGPVADVQPMLKRCRSSS